MIVFLTLAQTGRVLRVLTNDISGAGIRCTSDEPLPPGTPLHVEVQLPDGGVPIRLTARVAWSRAIEESRSRWGVQYEAGIGFVEIAPKDRAIILHYARLATPES